MCIVYVCINVCMKYRIRKKGTIVNISIGKWSIQQISVTPEVDIRKKTVLYRSTIVS